MIDGALSWSQVVALEALGPQQVLKADVGNREFFAGTRANATIATHNSLYKGIEP